jgi:hypothetical protein
MNKKWILCLVVLFSLLAFPLQAAVMAAPQGDGGAPASLVVTSAGLTWKLLVESDGWTLRVVGPQGLVFEGSFEAGSQPVLALKDADDQPLPDGVYDYELWNAPLASPSDAPSGSPVMSGTFTIRNGTALLPDLEAVEEPVAGGQQSPQSPDDQVIDDDLIVTHNACIGESCYSGMSWTYAPLTLFGSQLRIFFNDSSTGTNPTNDWAILINDTASGGTNYFAIEDQDAGTVPFKIREDAPNNSLFINALGNVGIGTGVPAAKLHVNGDLRVEGFITERSDRAAKTAFTAVDAQDVLARLSSIPITTWVYKDSPDVRHIGPMAQDFRAAYGFGPDDKHLAALDVNGVALAAIQALNTQVQEKDAQISEMQTRLKSVEAKLAVRQVASLWSQLAPLALGLLGLVAGMVIARKRKA